jgi:D-sedoheptulose 7-phosphate isomerase
MENRILKERIEEHIKVAQEIQGDKNIEKLVGLCADKIAQAYKSGGKAIFMGNGGSAADAQHMAAEFMGKYMLERKALPSIALTTNTSILTAIGNDYGYDEVFRRQLEGLAKKEDVVIGISTSGNSANVVKAVEYAKSQGIFTIALVGASKCKLDEIADICIKVPSKSTPRIQEMHEFLLHVICEIVEKKIFG